MKWDYDIMKEIYWGIAFCLMLAFVGIGGLVYIESKPEPRDPIQIQLDTLYTILVGPDSTSILNTVHRIKVKMDSICAIEYQGRC